MRQATAFKTFCDQVTNESGLAYLKYFQLLSTEAAPQLRLKPRVECL